MNSLLKMEKTRRRNRLVILLMILSVALLAVICLFAGSSNMTFAQGLQALLRKGSPAHNRIIWNIRIPRILAALIAGAGLSVAGLVMQTSLNNAMASPSTLSRNTGAPPP